MLKAEDGCLPKIIGRVAQLIPHQVPRLNNLSSYSTLYMITLRTVLKVTLNAAPLQLFANAAS